MGSVRSSVELAEAKEQGYFSIGRAAEISGVTAKMIRHYESLGLIPRVARTLGDYRVYTESEIHMLRFIRRARGLGFSMDEIEKNGYNLNISRYVSTSQDEVQIDLKEVNKKLKSIQESIKINTEKHNEFLRELGLPPI